MQHISYSNAWIRRKPSSLCLDCSKLLADKIQRVICLKKLNKVQKTHVKPEIKNIQTVGEIKSQIQRDKDKNGKPTNQHSETPKIQQK